MRCQGEKKKEQRREKEESNKEEQDEKVYKVWREVHKGLFLHATLLA